MTSRRNFLKTMGAGMAGVALSSLPSFAQATAPALMTSHETANMKRNKVRVAFIGIGNRGEQDIDDFLRTEMVEVAALCDVDLDGNQCQKMLNRFPKAKRFRDFRDLFEKVSNDFDAVVAAVPDHIHFPIAMAALAHGKHIYLEKPMVRTFLEAELLMQMARRHPELATQVGNQGHSEANYFQFKAWQEAGIIKDVTAVTAHMNNDRRWHKYDPDMIKMPEGDPIPDGMDWDTWHGGVRYHNYSAKFHQGDWRSWYDFGMGALGDWGAHILDTVHEFLNLGLPYEINLLYSKCHNEFFYPYSSTILFRFGARGNMPPCDVTWYDGVENLPPLPAGYGKSELAAGIPTTNQGVYKEEKLNPGKIIYSRDLIFKGGEGQGDGRQAARGAQEPEQPLCELSACLPGYGEDPLAVRDQRRAEPGVLPWRHRPAPEHAALLRPTYEAVHQQCLRQRHALRHAAPPRMGRLLQDRLRKNGVLKFKV